MATRRSSATLADVKLTKRQRQSISLETKLDICKRYERGEKLSTISRSYNLATSSVRTILNHKDKIKASIATAMPGVSLRSTKVRDKTMERMEQLLSLWLEEQTQRGTQATFSMIRDKAKSLWTDLHQIESGGSLGMPSELSHNVSTFKASHGWWERFKKRANLPNLRGRTDTTEVKPEDFNIKLKDLIKKGGFTAKQVFTLDEFGLYWKKMPQNCYLTQDEKVIPGFRPSRDRLTLLIGSNAHGDCKLKPLLVYHAENPRALKGYSKNNLPVVWKSNKKAWLTAGIFQDYVTSYLSPFITDYSTKNNLKNKILLVVDSAPCHPFNCEDFAENVQVLFLPTMSSAQQPMMQGISAIFKRHYTLRVLKQMLSEVEEQTRPKITEYWRNFNILEALFCVNEAWNDVSSCFLNSTWKLLWPESVRQEIDVDNELSVAVNNIVKASHEVGFKEISEIDVQELLDSHNQEMTNQELIELMEFSARNDFESDDPAKSLTVQRMSQAFKLIEQGLKILKEDDPNVERSLNASRRVGEGIRCYRELYKTKKQTARHINKFTSV